MITKEQKEFLEKYDFDHNVIISGDVGVGKTYEAKHLLKVFEALKEKDDDKYYGLSYEISDAKFKELLGSGSLLLRKPQEWQSKIQLYPLECMIKAKVLLYDDIGVSNATEAYLRKLTFVLEERIQKNLPTIFTTNLSPQELEEKLDKRIKSRIFLNSTFIAIIGEDRRKNNITII